jgi:hypothetical protein
MVPARAAITLNRFVINIERLLTSAVARPGASSPRDRWESDRRRRPIARREGSQDWLLTAVTRCLSSHHRPACYTRIDSTSRA